MNQSKALAIMKAGKNVFLTGSAGTGKTYTLNEYIRYLKVRKIPVAITASTGIAATHLNGITIHAWSGIGVKNKLEHRDLLAMKERKYLKNHLENVSVLIIDEISMLHKNQLDMVNEVLKFFKNNNQAFGGLQVIFCGDFFQLPPIGEAEETNRDKFAFMSSSWLEAKPEICYLTEQYRQKEGELNNILNEIRNGKVSDKSLELLKLSSENQIKSLNFIPKLFTHNVNVDNLNKLEIEKLKSKKRIYTAETKGNEKLVEMLKGNVRTEENLLLKIGAKVMFIKNNFEKGYVNGTLGEITGFNNEGFPEVTLLDGKKIICEPEKWAIEDEKGKALASFEQIPLRYAWAVTIHKSQGMTLDAAEIDLGYSFEKGQGYVALSRVKSLEGLRLTSFNQNALDLDTLAMKADKRFIELSAEAEQKYEEKELEKHYLAFVKNCGGITDKIEIEKNEKKLSGSSPKEQKKNTYLITKEFIDKGYELEKIAEERAMSVGTIIGHLEKISEIYPDTELHRFRPKSSIIKKVEKAYDYLKMNEAEDFILKDGKPKLSMIHSYLKGGLGYEEIKLSIIFME